MRIELLPPEVKSRISSGEVIEGPAEVVKELLENSLDAGATSIVLEVVKGGKRFISVADNGMGIHPQDMEKAILSGATSKLKSLEDLYRIRTYGYRGEALHAIASVSRLILRSRYFQEEHGFELVVEGGRVISSKPVGMQVGTQVEVYNLFYNVPLRRNFLSREDTERARIYKVFKALALANPHVAFRVVSEGKEAYRLKPAGSMKERVEELLEEKVEELSFEDGPIRISMFISLKQTRGELYLFINRRHVRNRNLTEYIKSLVGGKKLCVCSVEMPSYMVDVNMHPKKTEVKLHKENLVKELLRRAVGRRNYYSLPALKQEPARYVFEPELIGIIDDTLIVAKYGDYIYFFDQHLLSERYHYELGKEADTACRSSCKAGDRLTRVQAQELLQRWLHFENKEVCPHGRPIYYRIYLGELYKKLGRGY